jgi:ribonuclease H-related protein
VAKAKFYGVKSGKKTGVYNTWAECQKQTIGYSGALFKSFPTKQEAQEYVDTYPIAKDASREENSLPKQLDVYVDGSFNGGNYAWAFAVFDDGVEIFRNSGVGENPEAIKIRNVAGELAATMRAIRWADKQGVTITIHHDYTGIAAWAKGDWQAKSEFTQAYVKFVRPHLGWIEFSKVDGHTGVAGNELVDQLAGEALKNAKKA